MALLDLVRGWFGRYDKATNEVELVATDDDPAGLRGGKTYKPGDGLNLFKVSGNVVRPDGVHEEYGLLRFRLAPNRTDGAIECVLRRDDTEVPIFYADPNGVVFHVPVIGAVPKTIALRSRANGKLVCAEMAGAQPLIANRETPGPWEQFDVVVID